MFRHNFINLFQLSPQEKKFFDSYLNLIQRNDLKPEELAKVIEKLSSAPLLRLYKFTENDPKFKIFMAAHGKFDEVFALRLKNLGYVPYPLLSADKKFHVPLLQQLMGALVWSEMTKSPDPMEQAKFSDRAAELGIFSALKDSINRDLAMIEKTIQADLNLETINRIVNERIEKIISHAEKLGGLYWSIGFLDASVNLLKVAQKIYEKLDRETIDMKVSAKESLNDKIFSIRILKLAIKLAVFSENLEHNEKSRQILDVISKEGLFHPYVNFFKNWSEAKAYILSYVEQLRIPNPKDFIRNVIQEALLEVNQFKTASQSTTELSSIKHK